VKWGTGAFMANLEGARSLAESLVGVANGAGLRTTALLTDMNEPLASCAGNAIETRHAIAHLLGTRREARFAEIVAALGAEMLVTGGVAPDLESGRRAITTAIECGNAAERFARMVAGFGGPEDLMEKPDAYLASAPVMLAALPERSGFVTAIDTRAIGLAVVALGGGRTRPQDAIDPAVGLTELAGVGAEVSAERPLALVHARDAASAESAAATLRLAYRIGEEPPPLSMIVTSRLGRPL
jgi:thymidine phosphorylase